MKTTKYYLNKIGAITKAKAFYILYTEKGTYFGRIARTPENDLAFETENWDFFSKKLFKTEILREGEK